MSELDHLQPCADQASEKTPWFVFDPAEWHFCFFATEQRALEYFHREVKPFYREADMRGFCTDISAVIVGRVTQVTECADNHLTCTLRPL